MMVDVDRYIEIEIDTDIVTVIVIVSGVSVAFIPGCDGAPVSWGGGAIKDFFKVEVFYNRALFIIITTRLWWSSSPENATGEITHKIKSFQPNLILVVIKIWRK